MAQPSLHRFFVIASLLLCFVASASAKSLKITTSYCTTLRKTIMKQAI